ncbi:hypothetical protein PFISCL1PPCAC_4315, partial [Pristionchus fissidentatus]
LPDEILFHIFSFLPKSNSSLFCMRTESSLPLIFALRSVCKRWTSLLSNLSTLERLKNLRMLVNEIEIVQDNNVFNIRILYFPKKAIVNHRDKAIIPSHSTPLKYMPVPANQADLHSQLSIVLAIFAPRTIYLRKVHITRQF